MDKNDYAILKLLKKNARTKASFISSQINMSVSSVLDRIRKMENSGTIMGYTAILNEKALGNDVTALMEVTLEHPKYYDSFTQTVSRHPNIIDCYYLTGDYDFNLKICCASSAQLEEVHRTIKSIKGVSATKTHFVLKEVKNIYCSDLTEKNTI